MAEWEPRSSARQKEAVEKLLGMDDDLLQMREYVREVIRQAGGPAQMAQLTVTLLTDAKTNPDTKRKVLENITSMMKFVEAREGPPADLSQATEAELLALVGEAIQGARP